MQSMMTVTMTPEVCNLASVPQHFAFREATCKRLKYQGYKNFVWVREFTEADVIHWHYFLENKVAAPYQINLELCADWSRWMVNYYHTRIAMSERDRHYMANGNNDDHYGCCRWEGLGSDAGGRYAGKEGGKRYQKESPERFQPFGGRWHGTIGEVKCTKIASKKVAASTLHTVKVKIGGKEQVVATKTQYNRGESFEG